MLRINSVQHPNINPFLLNFLIKESSNTNGPDISFAHQQQRLEYRGLLDSGPLLVIGELAYIVLCDLREQEVYLFVRHLLQLSFGI